MSGVLRVLLTFFMLPAGLIAAPPFLVIGHRGAPRVHPGNTLESVRAALDRGANAIEVDLTVTRDGEVVLWHDACNDAVALVRQAGREPGVAFRPWVPGLLSRHRRPVHEVSLTDLQAHFGYARRSLPSFGRRLPYRIPTFAELVRELEALPPGKLQALFLDVKIDHRPEGEDAHCSQEPWVLDSFLARVRSVLEHSPLASKVIFMAASEGTVRALRFSLSDLPVRYSFDQVIPPGLPDPARYSAVLAARRVGATVASIGRPQLALGAWKLYSRVLEADLERRKGPGEPLLIAWTVDDPGELEALVRLGVDGILTNVPGVLASLTSSPGPLD